MRDFDAILLESVYQELLLEKYGDVQKKKYIEQGIESDTADSYIQKFDLIRKNKYKELFDDIPNVSIPSNRRNDISAYGNFSDLEAVVDYVKGQRTITPTKNIKDDKDSNVDPIYDENGLKIYRGDNANQCISIRGKWPYTWCVAAQGSRNLYNTYRYKHHEPSFYFVKDSKRLPTNKYHFFVIQVLRDNYYIVTSSRNDGDIEMSWDEVLEIQPKLEGLQNLFVNIPLSGYEKEMYRKFDSGISDEEFRALPYEDKRMYLDIVGHKKISDEKFSMLSDDLKSHYISFGIGLTMPQYESIKSNKTLIKRYKQITERKIKELDNEEIADEITFTASEYLVTNSKEIINSITRNSKSSYDFAKAVEFNLDIIPKKIINDIGSDSSSSYEFAEELKYNLDKIPKEIINGIARNMDYSYEFSEELDFNPDRIPKEIINTIASDMKYSYYFARGVGFNPDRIPKEIINSIASDSEYSYDFAEGLKFDRDIIPQEIINSIASDSAYSYQFAELLNFNLDRIPQEIINSIASDSDYSWDFAEGLKFDRDRIPKEIINTIASDSEYSLKYVYAIDFNPDRIPKEIINTIASDSDYSWDFAERLNFNPDRIPKEIINGIASDIASSYQFAELLNFNLDRISQEIINTIASDMKYSYYFAINLDFNLDRIPKEIVNSANKYETNIPWVNSGLQQESTLEDIYSTMLLG